MVIKKILLLVSITLLITGCGVALDEDKDNNNDMNQSNDESREGEVQLPMEEEDSSNVFLNEYTTILMENVESSDILFHEKIAFTTIEFSVRDSLSYSAGKDIYNISYLSSAKPEDTYDAYMDYIDTVTEEFANEYNRNIEGTVNQLPISVSLVSDSSEDREGYPVLIRISEDPSKFQEENRYFNDYPDLVELYKIDLENNQIYHTERSYTEAYLDGIKTYRISFLTTASSEDFTTFYTENYGEKQDFKSEEDEYQKQFSWSDSGFEHKIVLQKSNNMVGLQVTTPLP